MTFKGGRDYYYKINKTGILIDNVVSGVKYVNKDSTGFTDSNGEFIYKGGKIEFFLGGIKLGEVNFLPADNKVFVQDLLKLDRKNTSDVKLLTLSKLLQSIDSVPFTDEIEISQENFDKFNDINQNLEDLNLTTLLPSLHFTLKSDEEVQKHLKRTLVHYDVIKDTQAPTLSHNTQTFTTTVGTPLTLPIVTAIDDIDKSVEVKKEGIVDFDTVGTYTITYTYIVSTTITHNGFTYEIVTSPITDKKWLDRNLGATQVCTKSREDASFSNDSEYVEDQKDCFGDYYQWGRLRDGHEKRDSASVDYDANLTMDDSGIIKTTGADSDKFIKNLNNPYDWTDKDEDGSKRKAVWEKIDGTSICPNGFRVPTIDELKAETLDYSGVDDESIGKVKVTNRDTAFKNFLKFPVSGIRDDGFDSLDNQGHYGISCGLVHLIGLM